MLVQRTKALLRVGNIVQHLGNDAPPALDLALFTRAPAVGAIHLILTRERLAEATLNRAGVEAATQAAPYLGVDRRGVRLGVQQRAHPAKEHRPNSPGPRAHPS